MFNMQARPLKNIKLPTPIIIKCKYTDHFSGISYLS